MSASGLRGRVGVGAGVVQLHGGSQRLVAGGPGAVVVAGAGRVGRGADGDIEARAFGEGVAAHHAAGQRKAGRGNLEKTEGKAGNHKSGSSGRAGAGRVKKGGQLVALDLENHLLVFAIFPPLLLLLVVVLGLALPFFLLFVECGLGFTSSHFFAADCAQLRLGGFVLHEKGALWPAPMPVRA